MLLNLIRNNYLIKQFNLFNKKSKHTPKFSKKEIKKAILYNLDANSNTYESICDIILHKIHTCSYEIDKRYIYVKGLMDYKSNNLFKLKLNDVLYNGIKKSNSTDESVEKDFFEKVIYSFLKVYQMKKICKKYHKLNVIFEHYSDYDDKFISDIFYNIAPSYYSKIDNKKEFEEYSYILQRIYKKEHFFIFLKYYLDNFCKGKELSNKIYVKFSNEKEPLEIHKKEIGRNYYKYNLGINKDYDGGCGFSFGPIDKIFNYFESVRHYGELLMFLDFKNEQIENKEFYQQDYEFLGKEIYVEKMTTLKDNETLYYVLQNIDREKLYSLLKDKTFEKCGKWIPLIEEIVNIMEDLNGYEKTIAILKILLTDVDFIFNNSYFFNENNYLNPSSLKEYINKKGVII